MAIDSFVATVERHEQRLGLPGFNYHFVQGFGWGLGLTAAGATIALIVFALSFLLMLLSTHR
jgi:hypothetical protein